MARKAKPTKKALSWPCKDCKHTMLKHRIHVDPLSSCQWQSCVRRCGCEWYKPMTNIEYVKWKAE